MSGKAGSTAGRAATAVGLLVGFYVIALGVVAGLLYSVVALFTAANGAGVAKVALVLLIAAGAVVVGLVKALKSPRFEPYGIQLTEADQPHLWGLVRDLSGRVVTRPPDEIWLVPEVNAAVTEDAGMLGLRGGKRYLLVGLPLFVTMNVEQISAVIRHELGHYSHAHTRLGEINYRGRNTIVRTIQMLQSGGIVNTAVRKVFELYARLYFLVESAVSRRQELEADQAAGVIAGRWATQTALMEVPVLSAAWGFYFEQYVGLGLEYGFAPRDVFTSFPTFLNARKAELDKLRREGPDDTTGKWDSHPATSERVAALQSAPEHGQISDRRSATGLLASWDRLVPALERETIDFGDREPLPWEQYTARSLYTATRQHADRFYRALSRVTGRTPEALETVVAAAESGRLEELFARLGEANAPDGGLAAAVEVALLEARAAHIRHRWDAAAQLVRADGSELDLDEILQALGSGATGAAKARALLQSYGVDPRQAVGRSVQADARTADLVAVVSPAKVNKSLFDFYVTDMGFVLVPITGAFKRRTPTGRLRKTLESQTVVQLSETPGNIWIPFEDLRSTELRRPFPLRATFHLHDGRSYEVSTPMDVKGLGQSDEVLLKVVKSLAGAE